MELSRNLVDGKIVRTEFFEKFQKPFVTVLPSNAIPQKLYHYTSSSALIGILQENKIRATHIRHLNDEMEMRHCFEIFDRVKKEFHDSAEHANEKAIWYQPFGFPVKEENNDYFVACFSEVPDLLSQWTAYTKMPDGLCLGLDTAFFTEKPNRIIYDNGDAEESIRKTFTSIRTLYKENGYFETHPQKNDVILDSIDVLSLFLEYVAASTKKGVWQEEKEWRIIFMRSQNPVFPSSTYKFRTINGVITPYVEEKFWSSEYAPIREIITSPGANYSLAMAGILKLLQWRSTGGQISISPSKIPYRSR